MAKLNFFADPTAVPSKKTFDLIPTGEYTVKVVEVELKPTRTGKGMNLTFQIIEGDYVNRRVWVMLNLDHPDPAVVGRAMGELQGLCKAVGIVGELDTNDLLDKPLSARVYATRPKDGYPAKNSANNFKPNNWLYPPTEPSAEEDFVGSIPEAHEAQGEAPF